MSKTPALQSAMATPMPLPEDADGAPEWIHLLPAPADGLVQTYDKRGPYTMASFAEIIEASYAERGALEIDINHSSFLAAPRGERSDAAGWIMEMQAREDGLWGRVEWTDEGRRLVAGRSYRNISPVVMHDAAKRITHLANASLVNRQNLRGLAALHAEEAPMGMMERLIELLKLEAGATEEQVMEALTKRLEKPADEAMPAMQAQMTEIGRALGVAGVAGVVDGSAIVSAAKVARSDASTLVPALQAQITELTTSLNALQDGAKKSASETFVDGQIKARRMGLNQGNRDAFIAMHMENPDRTSKLIDSFAIMGPSGTAVTPPSGKDGKIALQSEEARIAEMIGVTAEEFTAQLEVERAQQEAAQ